MLDGNRLESSQDQVPDLYSNLFATVQNTDRSVSRLKWVKEYLYLIIWLLHVHIRLSAINIYICLKQLHPLSHYFYRSSLTWTRIVLYQQGWQLPVLRETLTVNTERLESTSFIHSLRTIYSTYPWVFHHPGWKNFQCNVAVKREKTYIITPLICLQDSF